MPTQAPLTQSYRAEVLKASPCNGGCVTVLKQLGLLGKGPLNQAKKWYYQGSLWAGQGGHTDLISTIARHKIKSGGEAHCQTNSA